MTSRCPCLSGRPFGECCAPVLAGDVEATTAEQLMRSRFTAFSVGDEAYLLTSWHPDTAPEDIELDPLQNWYRLDVRATKAGGLMDRDGVVEFSAYYRHPDGNGVLTEASRFVREAGRWLYVDGSASLG